MAYPASPHPYPALPNKQLYAWVNPNPAQTKIAVTFNALTEVENTVDYLRIEDDNGRPIATLTGTQAAGVTAVVPGPDFQVVLFSSGATQLWGFAVDSVLGSAAAFTYPWRFWIVSYADEPEPIFPPNQQYCWEYGGKLWMVVWGPTDSGQYGAPPFPAYAPNARMYYSTDEGNTWTESDSANRPLDPEPMGVWYDGAGVMWLVHRNDSAPYALVLSKFDMTLNGGLGGWVAVSTGPSGANQNNSNDIYITEDPNDPTSLLVLFTALAAGNGQVYWTRAPKGGGAWSAPVLVSDSGTGNYRRAQGILAHDGVTSLFWSSFTTLAEPQRIYHRTLRADDSLAAVQLVGATTNQTAEIKRDIWPVLYNGRLAVGYVRRSGATAFPAIFWGDPSNSDTPVWTTEDISATQGDVVVRHNGNFLALLVDGANLNAYWATEPQLLYIDLNELLWAQYDGANWSDQGSFWSPKDATNFIDDFVHDPSPFVRGDGSVGMAVARVNPSYDYDFPNSLGFETSVVGYRAQQQEQPQPPPAPSSPPVITGTRRMVVLVPNPYDHCLWRNIPPTRHIPQPSACCVRDPNDYYKWLRMPKGAIQFRKVGAVPTPLAAAGDVLVLRFTIPEGYDGVIHGLTQHYTGPGFLDGNGDIEWRLKINRVYAQFLGNVLVSLGSITDTHPLDDGIPVYSLQPVEYYVNVPNGSGGILPVNTQIVTVVEGFVWPRK